VSGKRWWLFISTELTEVNYTGRPVNSPIVSLFGCSSQHWQHAERSCNDATLDTCNIDFVDLTSWTFCWRCLRGFTRCRRPAPVYTERQNEVSDWRTTSRLSVTNDQHIVVKRAVHAWLSSFQCTARVENDNTHVCADLLKWLYCTSAFPVYCSIFPIFYYPDLKCVLCCHSIASHPWLLLLCTMCIFLEMINAKMVKWLKVGFDGKFFLSGWPHNPATRIQSAVTSVVTNNLPHPD